MQRCRYGLRVFLFLTAQKVSGKTFVPEHERVSFENRVGELSDNITQLQRENTLLLQLHGAKTKAIEELTQQLRSRGTTGRTSAFLV